MPYYRIKYSKEGPAKYISHLDLLRTFARAGKRAGLPLAFTQGFNPHPKISFAAPLGVGIAGEGEFADMELTGDLPAIVVSETLSASLPEGLQILETRIVSMPTKSLMAIVGLATYRGAASLYRSFTQAELTAAINGFLGLTEILVERRGKNKVTKIHNIRDGIFAFSGTIQEQEIVLEIEIKTGSSGNVRCEEVLGAFVKTGDVPIKGRFVLSRTGLYQATDDCRNKIDLWQ